MSLLKEAMAKGITFSKISVTDIRCNEENHYHVDNIKELANLIEKGGVNSGVAYYEEGSDGKHYTLLGGETRYRALDLLYKEGRGDGLFPLTIKPKPQNEWEEKLAIIQDNFQREKTFEDKKKEVEELEKIFMELKKQVPCTIPVGTLKRNWIASQTTMGATTVQKFLTGEYFERDTAVGKNEVKKSEHSNSVGKNNSFIEELRLCMESKLGTKVVFSKNKFSISYMNVADLNRILEVLNLGNVVNDSEYI